MERDHNMSFGNTIKKLRKELKMTQRELSDKLGVNFTYISKIENEKLDVPPSEELIRKMAGILEADPEELLDMAGKLDLKRLQQVAMDVPEAGTVLRRMQSNKVTDEQWKKIGKILDE
jgi:transcriptional regulator with XRE-family HTH domain